MEAIRDIAIEYDLLVIADDIYTLYTVSYTHLDVYKRQVCDGAKPSCAAKIASALYSGVIAQKMAMNHHVFQPDTGIVAKGIEATIDAIGHLGNVGMRETDNCILHMMIDQMCIRDSSIC